MPRDTTAEPTSSPSRRGSEPYDAKLSVDDEASARLGIAAFIATVAYPKSIAKRDEVLCACKAFMVQYTGRRRPQMSLPAGLLTFPTHKIEREFRLVGLRLATRRFLAVDIAIERAWGSRWTIEIDKRSGRIRKIQTHRKSPTELNDDTAKRLRAAKGLPYNRTLSTAHNVLKSVWSESRPVLHLAWALSGAMQRAGKSAWDWHHLLFVADPAAELRAMVDRAEQWRKILFALPELQLANVLPIRLII